MLNNSLRLIFLTTHNISWCRKALSMSFHAPPNFVQITDPRYLAHTSWQASAEVWERYKDQIFEHYVVEELPVESIRRRYEHKIVRAT
jgi:hypothetical protein